MRKCAPKVYLNHLDGRQQSQYNQREAPGKNSAIFMPLSSSLIFAVFYPLWVLRVVRPTRHRAEMPPDAGGCRIFAVFLACFLPIRDFSTYAV